MATAGLEFPEHIASAPQGHGATVRRTPLYLTSRGESLFAWLHTASQMRNLDHGVVICPPIGFEQLHSHRSLRHLAEALAALGIPTLRFDWHGTGDSAGNDEDLQRVSTWQANARDAVAWMRNQLGCKRVSVVGLRMGALLAAEALSDVGCENLVLWAPLTSGKAYVRQMQAIEKMAEPRPRLAGAAPGDIEAGGLVLSEETAAELASLNFLQCRPNCGRALVVGPFDQRLLNWLTSLAVAVDTLEVPGFAEMMLEPHFSQVPWQAVQQIAAWLRSQVIAAPQASIDIDLAAVGPSVARLPYRSRMSSLPHSPQAICERTMQFGGDAALFGIISEGEDVTDDLPTIVLLNAGSTTRVGPGRLSIDMARQLATLGFRCVRIDTSGLGDSVVPNVADENNPYAETVFRDVQMTLRELEAQYGVRRCILMGLCSGAYAAFQSAAQITDSVLVESVLINPLTYFWNEGMTLNAVSVEQNLKEHCYMTRMLNPKKLWSFLTGQTEVGYLAAVRVIRRRLQTKAKTVIAKKSLGETLAARETLGHPLHEDLRADLARVVNFGRRLAVFLAENDPGYTIMMYQARRDVKRLLKSGDLSFTWINDADHTFSRRAPRFELIRTVSEYLCQRYRAIG